jgi:hypothetical protein
MRDIHVPAGRRSLPSTSRTYPLHFLSSRQVHTPTQCSDFERNVCLGRGGVDCGARMPRMVGLLTYGAQVEGDAREDDGRSTELCVRAWNVGGEWIPASCSWRDRSASSAVLGSLDSVHVGYFTRPCCLVRWCLAAADICMHPLFIKSPSFEKYTRSSHGCREVSYKWEKLLVGCSRVWIFGCKFLNVTKTVGFCHFCETYSARYFELRFCVDLGGVHLCD